MRLAFLSLFVLMSFSFCVVAQSTAAKNADSKMLQIASALQSGMVVQQNRPLKIWGMAPAGSIVSVKVDWLNGQVQVVADEAGKFMCIVEVPPAKKNDFAKHSIQLTGSNEILLLDNILIGDVWLCSGQSNMQFGMKGVKDSATEIAAANYPNIRLLNVGLNFSNELEENFSGEWRECNPATVKGFSAVGYYFGRELHQQLNIPIGLIFSGIGASAAQAYVPKEVLQNDTMLNRIYLQPYLQSDRSKEKINGGFSFEKVIRPFLLYNAIIHPLTNLSIKGICWYQGEANYKERESYTHLTQTMIQSWRTAFAQGNLPFYYVQIAPYNYEKKDSSLADAAYFREAQQNIDKLDNTAMVTTTDVGEAQNLHPKNKKPIGIRLAKTALNRTYGMLEVAYEGPQYDYAEFSKNKAIIHFRDETVTGGLTTNDATTPRYFFMAGKDQKFYAAMATIDRNTIVLINSKVGQPVAIRYAFTNYPITNLQNGAGIPALQFRTDNWPE